MLLNLTQFDQIYLYRPACDFRKGIGGLSGIVEEQMRLDPFGRFLFVFCNRAKDKLKVLYWDQTGFALWYKALEKEKFKWPSDGESEVLSCDLKKLESFLMGLDPWQRPHKKLHFSYA